MTAICFWMTLPLGSRSRPSPTSRGGMSIKRGIVAPPDLHTRHAGHSVVWPSRYDNTTYEGKCKGRAVGANVLTATELALKKSYLGVWLERPDVRNMVAQIRSLTFLALGALPFTFFVNFVQYSEAEPTIFEMDCPERILFLISSQ